MKNLIYGGARLFRVEDTDEIIFEETNCGPISFKPWFAIFGKETEHLVEIVCEMVDSQTRKLNSSFIKIEHNGCKCGFRIIIHT